MTENQYHESEDEYLGEDEENELEDEELKEKLEEREKQFFELENEKNAFLKIGGVMDGAVPFSVMRKRKNSFSDFYLEVSGSIFHCHKIILSRCGFFSRLFEQYADLKSFAVEGFDTPSVDLVIQYLYGQGILKVIDGNIGLIQKLYNIAEKWELPDFVHYLLLAFRKSKLKSLSEMHDSFEEGGPFRQFIYITFNKHLKKMKRTSEKFSEFISKYQEKIDKVEMDIFKHQVFSSYEPIFKSSKNSESLFIVNQHPVVMLQGHIVRNCVNSLGEEVPFSDIGLKSVAEEKSKEILKCHKFMLSSRSKYFRTLFCGKFEDASKTVIEFEDMNISHIRLIIGYLYSGDFSFETTSFSLETLCQLILISEKYLLRGLKKRCIGMIRMMVSGTNISFLKEKYSGYIESDRTLQMLFNEPRSVLGMPSMEFRILCVGLDASGKTTALYKLKLDEVVTTIPTIGFNVETIEIFGQKLTMWDVGGSDKIRPLWRHYYANTNGIVMFVDGNDRDRIGEAKNELFRMCGEDELKDVPILVFINKQDLPKCMSLSEASESLEVDKIKERSVQVQGSVAVTGEGLMDGMEWLVESMM